MIGSLVALAARTLPRRGLCSFFVIALCLAIVDTGWAEDWPRWRGPQGDGTWRGPKLPETWPATGLPVKWRQPLGGGYAGVSASSGRVLTMDRPADSSQERIVCFDLTSGELRWEHRYDAPYNKLDYGTGPRAAPTIDGEQAFTLGAMGHVHCLDAATGNVLWSRDTMAEMGARLSEWGFAASPVIFEGLVIVHVAAQPGGCYVALDRRDGKEVWRVGDDPAGYATPIVVDRGGSPQLIGWTPEHVVGVDPRTGNLEWQIDYKVTYGVSIATPIYRDGLVFVTGYWEGSKAISLGSDRRDVSLAWEEKKELCGLMSQPLYRDGHVYCLDKARGVVCFKLASGERLWEDKHQLTPRGRNPQASLVWIGDEDRALALNSEGELVLVRLNPQGCQEQSRTTIIGPTWAHPAYADRFVIARDDQEIVCVELVPASK